MVWRDFIFSDHVKCRTRRHIVFWLFWWLYVVVTIFYTTKIPNAFFHFQPGLEELGYQAYSLLVFIKSILLVLTHFGFCYATIFWLLPNVTLKKNYWHLVSGLLILCSLVIPVGYLLYSLVYPFLDKMFGLHIPKSKNIVWAGIDASLVYAIKVSLIAVAITLVKQWWVRQGEKEQLEKQKINVEVQLLKAQIPPEFLFSTLKNISSEARVASAKAPEMLIKLSDILSYMLYECDVPKVKLEREIAFLRDYIGLEIIRQGDRLESTFQVNGDLNGQSISPLVLLPFIDNFFSNSNSESPEHVWINLYITIENNHLSMKIIHGIPLGINKENVINSDSMINIQKRLELLYSGRHDLKINAEHELLLINLNLKLEEPTLTEFKFIPPPKAVLNYA